MKNLQEKRNIEIKIAKTIKNSLYYNAVKKYI